MSGRILTGIDGSGGRGRSSDASDVVRGVINNLTGNTLRGGEEQHCNMMTCKQFINYVNKYLCKQI